MTTGIVPQDMKIARVIPIHKSGNQHTFNNYRPISILPAFSKIIEKVMSNKLIKYLESQTLIYKHQYGFRPKHSTIHPILHLLNHIANENDKPTKNLTLSIFIDLSKAFDTISHEILLKKLDNLGVRGVSNLWFRNYLTDRKQFMDIYDMKSSTESLICGVPQGSILGPLLFLIYVNDIANSTTLQILSFADDTTASMSSANIQSLYRNMNVQLEQLNTWFRANRLCLNVKKTKYILFRPHQSLMRPYEDIYLDGERVNQISHNSDETSFKFLGIYIDETLSWKYHVNKVCKKISSANYVINKVKNILPHSSLRNLYLSLIHSQINYGLLIWGGSKALGQVFKLQKKSIRIIHSKPYNSHTEPLFKQSEILKIHHQYILNVSMFMYQLKHDNLPKSFDILEYFRNRDQPHTRQIELAHYTRARTTYTSLLPLHQFPKIWNELGASLHDSRSLGSFKKKVKISSLNKYAAYVHCNNRMCKQCYPS